MLGIQQLRTWFARDRDPQFVNGSRAGSASLRIHGSARSDAGKVRTVNEDAAFFELLPGKAGGVPSALAVVADGMGGVHGGKVASEIAARTIVSAFTSSAAHPAKALRQALELANREIYRSARKSEELSGMGTTCVALALTPSFAWAAWVGDSRLYLIRGGRIYQMTEDHSVVQELVRRGDLSPAEAAEHKARNVVTRALGSHQEVDVAVWDDAFPIRADDRFLLCSDGLHDLLPSAEILEIVSHPTLDAASRGLIEAANRRGGHDNISAVVVEVAEPQDAAVSQPVPTRESDLPREMHL